MTGLTDELRFAIGTYTRLAVPAPTILDPSVAGRGLALGPVVGAGLGLISGLPLLLGDGTPLRQLLLATLTVALAAWLTRALHWDGLADLADGLGSRAKPDRARAIMRQSDIGPFGVLTLILTVALQVVALAMLPAGSPALAGWILAVTLGRFAIALACGPASRPARSEGLGALVVGSVTPRRLAVAAILTAIVALVEAVSGYIPWAIGLLAAPVAAIVVTGVVARVAERRIGGITGDVLGAIAELSTTAALLVLALA